MTEAELDRENRRTFLVVNPTAGFDLEQCSTRVFLPCIREVTTDLQW
jgi:hypothetical protein